MYFLSEFFLCIYFTFLGLSFGEDFEFFLIYDLSPQVMQLF